MNASKKIRMVIIEPSPVVRQGLRSLLEGNAAELSVTKEYDDLPTFREDIRDTAFDIILLNPALIHSYKHFNVRNLFPDYPDAAIVAIFYSYVNAETLYSFDGTLDIYDDGETMAKKLRKTAQNFIRQQHGNSDAGLSGREKEILIAVAKGMINKEIADKHNISIHTVISHRKNITRKTGIKTVSGLTIYALFNNLVSQEEL